MYLSVPSSGRYVSLLELYKFVFVNKLFYLLWFCFERIKFYATDRSKIDSEFSLFRSFWIPKILEFFFLKWKTFNFLIILLFGELSCLLWMFLPRLLLSKSFFSFSILIWEKLFLKWFLFSTSYELLSLAFSKNLRYLSFFYYKKSFIFSSFFYIFEF